MMDASNPESYSPAAIDLEIRSVIQRISRGVTIVNGAQEKALAARREFDRAWAQATLDATMNPEVGRNAEARKAYAVLNTMSSREHAEVLEQAARFAQATARALEKELEGLRSLLVTSRLMYGGDH